MEGVLPPSEAVGDGPLHRGGVGKAQHLLGQAHVLRGVLRRVGGCGGLRLPGAEHRRVGVVQCSGQRAVKGVTYGRKGRRKICVAAHQCQESLTVRLQRIRGRQLYGHHPQQQRSAHHQLPQAAHGGAGPPACGGPALRCAAGHRAAQRLPVGQCAVGGPAVLCLGHAIPSFCVQCMRPSGRAEPPGRREISLLTETFLHRIIVRLTGCSAAGSALGSGPRGRGFKSPHSDHAECPYRI